MPTPRNKSKSSSEQQYVKEMQKDFSRKVSTLLLPNNPSGTAFLSFLHHYLAVWNLRDVDPSDILAEAVYQGLQYIATNHKPIITPKTWLRVTSLHLMKNLVRSSVKRDRIFSNLKELSSETESPLVEAERFEWLDKFNVAINQLPPDEQDIVRFRLFDEKTYKQIHHWLEMRDGQAPNIPLIRKRYSRALKRLKEVMVLDYQAR